MCGPWSSRGATTAIWVPGLPGQQGISERSESAPTPGLEPIPPSRVSLMPLELSPVLEVALGMAWLCPPPTK